MCLKGMISHFPASLKVLYQDISSEYINSPKKNVKIRAYSEPLIREIAEKQIRWVIDNS